MSHPEHNAFRGVRSSQPVVGRGASVLEVGAYDVSGSVREVSAAADTSVGVDLTPGPGVDVVAFGHEVDHASGAYDADVSGEYFEHDPRWRLTFRNMARMARPGGVLMFISATRREPRPRALTTIAPGGRRLCRPTPRRVASSSSGTCRRHLTCTSSASGAAQMTR